MSGQQIGVEGPGNVSYNVSGNTRKKKVRQVPTQFHAAGDVRVEDRAALRLAMRSRNVLRHTPIGEQYLQRS